MVRYPAVAGQFYPKEEDALRIEIDGILPECDGRTRTIGAIVPHAGYMYSGLVAGETYAKVGVKDTYIIIGPNHVGNGPVFASSNEAWETPLGTLDIDMDLLDFIKKGDGKIEDDRAAHIDEHSIEVQLPFIKSIASSAKIVPISVKYASKKEMYEVTEAICSAIKESGKEFAIIASSDMTHYEARGKARMKDDIAIQKIISLDPEGLIDVVEENNISMCGYIPAAIMLMCVNKLCAKKAELVKYTDSGYTTGETDNVVGYAGIIISY
ncbi:MAG: AmmeMemoRadiSam system protein B [Candidatus Aadella gelida]|nr:AmmeMemoRadiSam system protein B [Candidatus Aadella gelida]